MEAMHTACAKSGYALLNFCTQIFRPLVYGVRTSSKASVTADGSCVVQVTFYTLLHGLRMVDICTSAFKCLQNVIIIMVVV